MAASVRAARHISHAWLALPLLLTAALVALSVAIGAGDFSFAGLLAGTQSTDWQLLVVSRLPRTLALLLAGMSLAVAGLIMQMLVRNRFVEPSTAGTIEAATLGVLALALLAPDTPVFGKMLVAAAFAMAGTFLFLGLLRRIPLRSPYLVPLVGLILGGVIQAVTTFFAFRHDMLQTLHAWTVGDFSGVLRGRYELLWLGALLAFAAWVAADRFTVAGMGQQFTTNLGLNYKRLTFYGLLIVSAISAVVVVTAGSIPFLGLIVPNVVSILFGDNMRRSVPWVALLGGLFVLACDIIGRLVVYPYEIPIGTVVGIIGGALFLFLLLRGRSRDA
ncbi:MULTISPECIES: ABC transporter permease [Massilia]|uniref:Iron chelate uptake ABC transporter family permease subunit n=1 Tax=Massilia arenae TaxID=2603288 RepID=A0A5C7FU95_9BURK|nr:MULTISPECIES: iron chelate uptake ABC transporter family permease subunit [Massilia]MDY0962265.1 iron chelate uptake ABC transporter family permease subunit [Massilia sp. CFBP9026]TXF98160.1 iron chelate uptake ABC transporter family permease subunit [Massilia arenae]